MQEGLEVVKISMYSFFYHPAIAVPDGDRNTLYGPAPNRKDSLARVRHGDCIAAVLTRNTAESYTPPPT